MKIKEIIIVEGRDDTAAINAAVDAQTIETHGFGFDDAIWPQIDRAYETVGIIIFTDPDFAGGKIRRRLLDRYPHAREAFVAASDAEKAGDIGVENASPETIRRALQKVCTPVCSKQKSQQFTMDNLYDLGLVGTADAASLRKDIGKALGIGYGNGKAFLRKLNHYGIAYSDFVQAVDSLRK